MIVSSRDGTRIAFDRRGDGPALILVGGGLDDGSENAPLAAELARSFTVFNYARRGRGDSGDTQPYALAREIEDLEALVAEAGSAHAYELAGDALAASLPNAERQVMPRQGHVADPQAVVPVLEGFLRR
jgi:hypothetical protein